jgi:SAM-dependent methyltransferase
MERKLFQGDKAYVSTFEFHQHRERAPHLEQPDHRARLLKAAETIRSLNPTSVVDLGCGDGGLLSLIKDIPSWGYDFAPANQAGWAERGVKAFAVDVFNGAQQDDVAFGELAVATEVIEHLQDPHGAVEWIARHAKYIVASSPSCDDMSGDCHSWAWDHEGYFNMFVNHFVILDHFDVEWSQMIVGETRYATLF